MLFFPFVHFSPGLVQLYIAGLPLRSCPDLGPPYHVPQCPVFVSGCSRIQTHVLDFGMWTSYILLHLDPPKLSTSVITPNIDNYLKSSICLLRELVNTKYKSSVSRDTWVVYQPLYKARYQPSGSLMCSALRLIPSLILWLITNALPAPLLGLYKHVHFGLGKPSLFRTFFKVFHHFCEWNQRELYQI